MTLKELIKDLQTQLALEKLNIEASSKEIKRASQAVVTLEEAIQKLSETEKATTPKKVKKTK